jgi:hypothetical protein
MNAAITVTPTIFRADYPEFVSTALYPDSAVNYYLSEAGLRFTSRWDTEAGTNGRSMLDIGVELFIAHNLVLERQAQAAAASGAPPGLTSGPVSSKSVGPVSISYDTTAALENNGGYFNLTTYGLRLMRLINMFGAGPVLVGVGNSCGEPWFSGPAWPGPFPYPAPGGSGFSS